MEVEKIVEVPYDDTIETIVEVPYSEVMEALAEAEAPEEPAQAAARDQ